MGSVFVGLPVLHYVQRFHFNKGRQWNAIEHLVLQALAKSPATAGLLAEQSALPRRVILEVLVRLMRAGWVELKPDAKNVCFAATQRGSSVAFDDDLPVVPEPMTRRMSFAVDLISGSVFRRRDLTMIWPDEWEKRTAGRAAVRIERPPFSSDFGRVTQTLDVLFNEDEKLMHVDANDKPPAERLAIFHVRNGQVEDMPPRSSAQLVSALQQAAKKAPAGGTTSNPVEVSVPIIASREARPIRRTAFRRDDLIRGGKDHEAHLKSTIRKSKKFVVIHSTFLNADKVASLIPDFKVAAAAGSKIDLLWGQASIDGSEVKSLTEAEKISELLSDAGLSGSVSLHLFSTRSHAKFIIADDGGSATLGTVGSCNWLYSGFESYELSVRLRDPHLVADLLVEAAELVRPRDGSIPEFTSRFAQLARELYARAPLDGNAEIKLLVGTEHDDCVLRVKETARRRILVLSHRLGIVAKPAILIPFSEAAEKNKVAVSLFYGQTSGPVKHADAMKVQWSFKEQGVDLLAIHQPRVHAKLLAWDDDDVAITSLNWLSADTPVKNQRQEIGVYITQKGLSAFMQEEFERTRSGF